MNSRFRNVGLCFQNMNSGPGRPGAPEALGCQLHLLAGKRCWSEGAAGRPLNCLDDECICHGRMLVFKQA